VKYNYEGGNVFFRASLASDESLCIEISDNGMGIAEEHLDRLFEPFERLDFDNSDIEGTGIGLSVTKQLVEAMGGKIGVTSTKGEGSTFWIELPRGKGSDTQSNVMATSRPLAPADKVADNIKVLYIEDNAVNARVVSAALTNRGGYDILVSKTAEEGLTLAEQKMPDIILLDINLPGIDGYTALKEIRNIKAISSIPVLAVTAKVMDQDIEEGKKAGFDDYLAKPININLLYETIDKHVSVVTGQPLNVA
jgi:CheY-like chemotaxis protein